MRGIVPCSPSNAVVVGLAEAADGSDIVLDEVVLSEVRDALLGEDKVGLEGDDVGTNALDILLLNLQHACEVLALAHFDVSLALALGVLQRAVKQQNAGVLDAIFA